MQLLLSLVMIGPGMFCVFCVARNSGGIHILRPQVVQLFGFAPKFQERDRLD
jgi:hypothetical protein